MLISEFTSKYPFTLNQNLVWGDMDAFQHLNNVAYFRLFESVRIAFFEKLGIFEVMQSQNLGPILHSTDCRYRIPLVYPDELLLGARVSRIEFDRYEINHGIFSLKNQKLAAHGNGLIVCYDYTKNQKAKVPANLITSILNFQSKCKPEMINLE
tara:strand:+ start:9662 stop:10123 length:462 start_codon:yes stop_codon:yes gene_type:complete